LWKAREKGEEKLSSIMEVLDFNESDKERIKKILDGEYDEEITYESIRKQEWNTLIQGEIDDSHHTGYKSIVVDVYVGMKPYFSSIHKIESLPEIQVLQGFTRIEYLDRFEVSEQKDLIPIMKNKNTNWLPGIRNNGEGIFFQFDENSLKDWERNTNHSKLTEDT